MVSILTAMKNGMGERSTTVFAHQGHYALDQHHIATYRFADLIGESIADLIHCDLPTLRNAARVSLTEKGLSS